MQPAELLDLISDIELLLVDTVAQLEQAETDRLFVAVLELEHRVGALHDALAFVAERIAGQELV